MTMVLPAVAELIQAWIDPAQLMIDPSGRARTIGVECKAAKMPIEKIKLNPIELAERNSERCMSPPHLVERSKSNEYSTDWRSVYIKQVTVRAQNIVNTF
jgi:hypothetical protein